jgi:hypothetical protein
MIKQDGQGENSVCPVLILAALGQDYLVMCMRGLTAFAHVFQLNQENFCLIAAKQTRGRIFVMNPSRAGLPTVRDTLCLVFVQRVE